MLDAKKALALANQYTDDSLKGAGALEGKPCQIQSITPITGGNRVVFLWVDNSGTSHTESMDVIDGTNGTDGTDGTDGVGIVSITKTGTSGLVDTYTITLTNGNTETFTVTNGKDGTDGTNGTDGTDGTDGFSPIATVTKSGDVYTISIEDKNGTTTEQIDLGDKQDKTLATPLTIGGEVQTTVEDALGAEETVIEDEISARAFLGGHNLLNNTLFSQTYNNIEYTVNNDKSISVNVISAPVSNTGAILGYVNLKAGIKYILSGGINANVRVDLRNSDYSMWQDNAEAKEVTSPKQSYSVDTFTPNNDATVMIYLRIGNGVQSGDVGTVYPMLRLASDHANTYRPYVMTNKELTDDFKNRFILTPRTKYLGIGNKTTLAITVSTKTPSSNYMQGVICLKGHNTKTVDCLVGFNLTNGNESVNSYKFIDHTGENQISLDSITVNGSNVEIVLSGFSVYTWLMVEYANTLSSVYENNTNVPEWSFT